ncbi:MAG TPA: hypothetical protein VHY20_13005, partial [Pirellulales bacterium]|nr:hypothetical protein [Pirellulales bacterium]
MSIAAPTPRNAPLSNPRAADADLPVIENAAVGKTAGRRARAQRTARRLPRTRTGQRIAGWFERWRLHGRRSSIRQAIAPGAISCVVHAALVGGLALCTLAPRDPRDALELAVELHQLRPPPAMAARELQHELPELLTPAGDAASQVHLHAGAAIDPAVWAPHIEPAMLAMSAATPLSQQRSDRELAPEQHAMARILPLPAAPEAPVKKPAEWRRTVISLPAEFKGLGGMFAGRQPALRPLLIKQLGGTDETEAAVKLGLEWLKKHQQPDGRWCLHAFGTLPDCRGQCTHSGIISDSSGTALALLPFLAAGSTHLDGEHAQVVSRGLAWLMDHQLNSGGWSDSGIVRMYAHGQATIALAEAYAMTHDPRLLKS